MFKGAIFWRGLYFPCRFANPHSILIAIEYRSARQDAHATGKFNYHIRVRYIFGYSYLSQKPRNATIFRNIVWLRTQVCAPLHWCKVIYLRNSVKRLMQMKLYITLMLYIGFQVHTSRVALEAL